MHYIQYFLLFINGLFLTPHTVVIQRKTHCTCAFSSIMAKQFDIKHFFLCVKKSCQTDFNSNIQPLELEAAVKKDKESVLTESVGKYIFFSV